LFDKELIMLIFTISLGANNESFYYYFWWNYLII